MASDSASPPAKGSRGRPRSERARSAILASAIDLMLVEGLDAVSMDMIASRAGASKATIYRRWPTKEALAIDALQEAWPVAVSPLPDTGSLSSDLQALMEEAIKRVRSRPFARVIAALITRVSVDDEFARVYRERFVEPRRIPGKTLIVRAIERGEVPADADVEVALDLLYGPIYHRVLHRHATADDAFVRAVVVGVVRAVGASDRRGSR